MVDQTPPEGAAMPRTSTSYAHDKEALLKRLRRMEGQVRGLQRMVEEDRYCLDVVQQVNALTAAAREVSLLMLEDHLRGCVQNAIKEDHSEAAIKEMVTVLGKALRQ
jgi:CsoR family transcriptional regulator, copper-sensing transcriptional repressor